MLVDDSQIKSPGYKSCIKINTSRNSYVKLTTDRILVTEMNKTKMAKSHPEGQKVEGKASVITSKLQNSKTGPSQKMKNNS